MREGYKEVKVRYGYIDGECMPMQCVCGYGEDTGGWIFVISHDES
jgi:hypothetical protein